MVEYIPDLALRMGRPATVMALYLLTHNRSSDEMFTFTADNEGSDRDQYQNMRFKSCLTLTFLKWLFASDILLEEYTKSEHDYFYAMYLKWKNSDSVTLDNLESKRIKHPNHNLAQQRVRYWCVLTFIMMLYDDSAGESLKKGPSMLLKHMQNPSIVKGLKTQIQLYTIETFKDSLRTQRKESGYTTDLMSINVFHVVNGFNDFVTIFKMVERVTYRRIFDESKNEFYNYVSPAPNVEFKTKNHRNIYTYNVEMHQYFVAQLSEQLLEDGLVDNGSNSLEMRKEYILSRKKNGETYLDTYRSTKKNKKQRKKSTVLGLLGADYTDEEEGEVESESENDMSRDFENVKISDPKRSGSIGSIHSNMERFLNDDELETQLVETLQKHPDAFHILGGYNSDNSEGRANNTLNDYGSPVSFGRIWDTPPYDPPVLNSPTIKTPMSVATPIRKRQRKYSSDSVPSVPSRSATRRMEEYRNKMQNAAFNPTF
ncbi:MAG: hypothetical protein ACTSUE_18700 [Promethearchaeota archaeon]